MLSLTRHIARQLCGLLAGLLILSTLVPHVSAQDEAAKKVKDGTAPAASSKTTAKQSGGLLGRPRKSDSAAARPNPRPANQKPYLEVYQLKSADAIDVTKTLDVLFPGAVVNGSGRSRRIHIHGTKKLHTEIAQLIKRLDEEGNGNAAEAEQTVIFRLKNLQAIVIARSLERGLHDREIQIEPEPVTNSLLVTATEKKLQKFADILQQLDKAPDIINLDISLVELSSDEGAITDAIKKAGAGSAELISGLIKSGKVRVLNRFRISAVDGTESHVQTAEEKSVPSGRVFPGASRGGTRTVVQGYESRETGTSVVVEPKRTGDREVTLDLEIDSTRIEAPERSADAGEETSPARHRALTTTLRSTIRVPEGQPVLVQATTQQDGPASRQFAVLVTATVGLPKPARKTTGGPDPNHTGYVYYLKNAAADQAKKVVIEVYRDHADKLNITAEPRTNSLIIRGDGNMIQQIEQLLKALDSSDPKKRNEIKIDDFKKAIKGR